jgi:FdhD protein
MTATTIVHIWRHDNKNNSKTSNSSITAAPRIADVVVTEEPLEIVLGWHTTDGLMERRSVAITMRTPQGFERDKELAVGFLFTERIITGTADIEGVWSYEPTDELADDHQTSNSLHVQLRMGVVVDWQRLERHFYTHSSCGICGKASLEALEVQGCAPFRIATPLVHTTTLATLPERLRTEQSVFERTGGLHACGLFHVDNSTESSLLLAREDIGRHNALDKLIGAELLTTTPRFADSVLLVSGRVSFELVQKALVAGIPFIAAVGAPSSLAVQTAERFGMTLVGFLRDERWNLYCGAERVIP